MAGYVALGLQLSLTRPQLQMDSCMWPFSPIGRQHAGMLNRRGCRSPPSSLRQHMWLNLDMLESPEAISCTADRVAVALASDMAALHPVQRGASPLFGRLRRACRLLWFFWLLILSLIDLHRTSPTDSRCQGYAQGTGEVPDRYPCKSCMYDQTFRDVTAVDMRALTWPFSSTSRPCSSSRSGAG